jgi:GT2 family glycosyltransferase
MVDQPQDEMRVGAVIVGYHRYDLLDRCLAALKNGSLPPARIVVVDNDSDEALLAELVLRHPDCEFIANSENPGYARACNQGRSRCDEPLLLFINPDVEVDRASLKECASRLTEDKSRGIVTARLTLPDGSLDHACHRGFPTPWAAMAYYLKLHRLWPNRPVVGRYTLSWLDTASPHDIDACSGAFLLIRADVLDLVDGWDERYWFYAEDLDLCYRVRQAGFRVRYDSTANALHLKSATSGFRRDRRLLTPAERAHRARVKMETVASHRLFFETHYSASTALPIRWLIRGSLFLLGLIARARYFAEQRQLPPNLRASSRFR